MAIIYVNRGMKVGYYQMSYPLYMFFVAMASGIPITMSKMISESNAINDIKTSFQVVLKNLYINFMLGDRNIFVLFFFF